MFKCKIFRQVPAFMVAPQQEESGRVGNFQRPQVEDALNTHNGGGGGSSSSRCYQT